MTRAFRSACLVLGALSIHCSGGDAIGTSVRVVLQRGEMLETEFVPVRIADGESLGTAEIGSVIHAVPFQMSDFEEAQLGAFPYPKCAHSGGDLVVSAGKWDFENKGWMWRLEHRRLGTDKVNSIQVGRWEPTVMQIREGVATIGAATYRYSSSFPKVEELCVGTINLNVDAPSFTVVHRRETAKESLAKYYDLLIRKAAHLVAVDDVVEPVYADSFFILSDGALDHRSAWELPELVNGQYIFGALDLRDGDLPPRLYMGIRYSVMTGTGQKLVAFPLRPDSMTYRNPSRHGHEWLDESGNQVPRVEEFRPRGPGDLKLAGGENYTPWRAMAAIESSDGVEQIVIAAGSRGLLLFPPEFRSDPQARMVDVGGDCVDVLAKGSTVIALTGEPEDRSQRNEGDTSKLLQFQWRDGSLTKVAELAIPGGYCSGIVD